ncbi:MAG: GH25 family lysozyme [Clostridia bacterium]
MKGIDVSVYQQKIDWTKVKDSGVGFVMVKASQGGSIKESGINPFPDRFFETNVQGASAAGIKCGAYHYLTGTTVEDVKKEATFFIKTLEQFRDKIVYPCAVDIEEQRYTFLSKEQNSLLAKTFCNAVKAAGFLPMLYTNRAFSTYYFDMNALLGIDVWFAIYRTPRSKSKKPDDVPAITLWQWSEKGSVDGISGNVDINEGYFDYGEIQSKIEVGDTVKFKLSAEKYTKNGAKIPDWVKTSFYHVVTKINSKNNTVLLGKGINLKTKRTAGGIMTWTDPENLEMVDEI